MLVYGSAESLFLLDPAAMEAYIIASVKQMEMQLATLSWAF